jgi:glycosyltransferase involved in cell wall biosynthesis
MTSPVLSIVTPVRNGGAMLHHHIQSVLQQEFPSVEHIFVDGMSTDSTENTIRDYQKTAPHPVRYIREPDSGVYEAMNKGIRLAKGEWVHILNADDQYASPDVLEKVFSIPVSGYDLLANDIEVIMPIERLYIRACIDEKIKEYRFPHPGIILRRRFYEVNGYYDERFKIAADAVYNLKYFSRAKYHISGILLVRMSGTGLSVQPTMRNLYERALCHLLYHRYLISVKLSRVVHDIVDFWKRRRQLKKEKFSRDGAE